MIIPAIDIRNGRCVRLLKGDFDAETVYPVDPVVLARQYDHKSARCLHIVDLDAARDGSSANRDLILQMTTAVSIPVQLGGGIRSTAIATEILGAGIHRVVLGSTAMKEPDVVLGLVNQFGADRVCIALDVKPDGNDYRLTASGWLESVKTDLETLLDFYVQHGIAHVLITDVSRDGAMSGPNVALYRSVMERFPSIHLQASGGVRSVEDIRAVRNVGASAAIVGKALLEGKIQLDTELEC